MSRYVPFSASAGSDGLVRVSNLMRMNQRTNKPLLVTLYQLLRDEGDGFYFKDGCSRFLMSRYTRERNCGNGQEDYCDG